MSIRGNGTPRGHGDAKNAPKEKKALRQKWEAAPIAYPYDEIPEAQQFLTCCPATADRMIDAVLLRLCSHPEALFMFVNIAMFVFKTYPTLGSHR